jgi:hypothetical protein
MESERIAARLRPLVHGRPLSASFWRAACAGPARLGGACTIRPGASRCRTLAGCRDVLSMTPSSSRTGAAIKPGTVHETSPNTSAATASRRNAAAGPIE